VLKYKTKRNIVNRAYQSSPDNIVGKMTIASLDRELAAAEQQKQKDPVIVPIFPRPGPVDPDFLVKSRHNPTARSAFAPASATSVPASLNLVGSTPNFPSSQLTINTGEDGKFRVLNGKDESLIISNFRIAVLIDSEDANKEKAGLAITSDDQTFTVRGKSAGSCEVMATKHSGIIFKDSGFVTMALAVNEPTLEQLWQPTLVPTREPPRKKTVFMFGQQLGLVLGSERFVFVGSVNPLPQIKRNEFQIGFVQTLRESMMEAVFTNDAGGGRRIFESTGTTLPVRDSLGAIPWTKPEGVVELASAQTLEFSDRPEDTVPWQTLDKSVTLRSSTGSDKFTTFFIARHKTSGQVTVLGRVRWQTSWDFKFDFSREAAEPVGDGGSITSIEILPEGGERPILGGSTALETLKLGFRN
jgi:hypothetical protein